MTEAAVGAAPAALRTATRLSAATAAVLTTGYAFIFRTAGRAIPRR